MTRIALVLLLDCRPIEAYRTLDALLTSCMSSVDFGVPSVLVFSPDTTVETARRLKSHPDWRDGVVVSSVAEFSEHFDLLVSTHDFLGLMPEAGLVSADWLKCATNATTRMVEPTLFHAELIGRKPDAPLWRRQPEIPAGIVEGFILDDPTQGPVFAKTSHFASLPFPSRLLPDGRAALRRWKSDLVAQGCSSRLLEGVTALLYAPVMAPDATEPLAPSLYLKPDGSAPIRRIRCGIMRWFEKEPSKKKKRAAMRALRRQDPFSGHLAELAKQDIRWHPSRNGSAGEPVDFIKPSSALLKVLREMAPVLEAAVGRTHLFVLPWLKQGGMDRGALHFIHAVTRLTGKAPVVITTDNAESPLFSELPAGTLTWEHGRASAHLTWVERRALLELLIRSVDTPVLHIINSFDTWGVLKDAGARLRRRRASVYASIVNEGAWDDGVRHGFARDFLAECEPWLDGVIADGFRFPAVLRRDFGCPADFLRVVHFPTKLPVSARFNGGDKKTVLWASRFDQSKRPDLLVEIARRMPGVRFEVWGQRVLDKGSVLESGNLPANLVLCGPYSGYGSLPHERYAAHLYTTDSDGLPNIILEAAAYGLPLVAPVDVGSIGEVLDETTGFPVTRCDDVDGYVAALNAVLADHAEARCRWQAAWTRVSSRHCDSSFDEALNALPGYIPSV